MNSPLAYTGIVTLNLKKNGKTISQKLCNHGTHLLFETYARALSGYNVSNLIPTSIDIGHFAGSPTDDFSDTEFSSHMRNVTPVTTTFVSKTKAGVTGYDYGEPFTRVEAVMNKSMFTSKLSDTGDKATNMMVLRCGLTNTENALATVSISDLSKTISQMPIGAQLIIVWDLFITNKSTTDTQ